MKKEKNATPPQFIEISKKEFSRFVLRYPFDDRNVAESETSFTFDRKKNVKGFLYSESGRVAYVWTSDSGLYVFDELKLVPSAAYQRERPQLLPGQEQLLKRTKIEYATLAWEVSGASNFHWTENGMDCDWSSDFFLAHGFIFPGEKQPVGLGCNAKTASLWSEKKELLGWYVFCDSKEEALALAKEAH